MIGTGWFKFELIGKDFMAGYEWPGVYKIRMIDIKGIPVVIGRFLANDEGGILAIGESKNVAQRLQQFYRAFNGKEFKHSVANRFFLIRYVQSLMERAFSDGVLEFAAYRMGDKNESRREEEKLLKTYFKIYGELPPLNGAMPDNHDFDWASL